MMLSNCDDCPDLASGNILKYVSTFFFPRNIIAKITPSDTGIIFCKHIECGYFNNMSDGHLMQCVRCWYMYDMSFRSHIAWLLIRRIIAIHKLFSWDCPMTCSFYARQHKYMFAFLIISRRWNDASGWNHSPRMPRTLFIPPTRHHWRWWPGVAENELDFQYFPFSALEAFIALRMILGYRVTPPSSKRPINYYHLKSMYIYVYIYIHIYIYIYYIAFWCLEGPNNGCEMILREIRIGSWRCLGKTCISWL